jgi:hypothetical protein
LAFALGWQAQSSMRISRLGVGKWVFALLYARKVFRQEPREFTSEFA